MTRRLLALLCSLTLTLTAAAQRTRSAAVESALKAYFAEYAVPGYRSTDPMQMNRCRIDRDRRTLTVVANDAFTSQPFTPASVRAIYDALRDRLPAPYKKYRIAVVSRSGKAIEERIAQ